MSKVRRPENKPLPERWRFKHGAFYYRPRDGEKFLFDGKTEFRLGKTKHEAHRTFAERIQWDHEVYTMAQLCDRYATEHLPLLRPRTQIDYSASLGRIRIVFNDNAVRSIEPPHIYRYKDFIAKKHSKHVTNIDLAVLSSMFSKSIEWGVRSSHPMTGRLVTKFSVKPRKRYVDDWELLEAMKVAPMLVRTYLPLKLLTGLRKSEMLSIKLSDVQEDGLYAQRAKGGKLTVYEWTDALRQAIDLIKANRGRGTGPYLFCTREGQPYIKEDGSTSGFDSVWQRFMGKALSGVDKNGQKLTALEQRFTEHDVRAKVGSDSENLARAQQLLGHASPAVTDKHYRRKAERIRPTS